MRRCELATCSSPGQPSPKARIRRVAIAASVSIAAWRTSGAAAFREPLSFQNNIDWSCVLQVAGIGRQRIGAGGLLGPPAAPNEPSCQQPELA